MRVPRQPAHCVLRNKKGSRISEVESVCAYDRTRNKKDRQQQLQGCRQVHPLAASLGYFRNIDLCSQWTF